MPKRTPSPTIIGIDPGLTGALAVVRPGTVLACYDMPVETGAGNRRRVSAPVLVQLLKQVTKEHGPAPVALEQVSAMPKQGVSSMFSLGRSLGVVEAVTVALGLELTFYSAQHWKRRHGLVGRPKDASRTRAMELYPAAADWLVRKKDHGRADAILIAHMRLTR